MNYLLDVVTNQVSNLEGNYVIYKLIRSILWLVLGLTPISGIVTLVLGIAKNKKWKVFLIVTIVMLLVAFMGLIGLKIYAGAVGSSR